MKIKDLPIELYTTLHDIGPSGMPDANADVLFNLDRRDKKSIRVEIRSQEGDWELMTIISPKQENYELAEKYLAKPQKDKRFVYEVVDSNYNREHYPDQIGNIIYNFPDGDMQVKKIVDLRAKKAEKDLKQLLQEAYEDSKNGYVQHVEKTDSGYRISDWYGDETVASFENGRVLKNDTGIEVGDSKEGVSNMDFMDEDEENYTETAEKYIQQKEATGEANQDYDKEFFDEIANQLESAGFPGITHREFDKYQGVYLNVPGVDKFWIKEVFSTGAKSKEDREKPYTQAYLEDPEGDKYSANSGDYFQLKPDYVFEGYILHLTLQNGEEKEIENPTKSDLPDLLEVGSTFTYEKGTETEHVLFTPEHTTMPEDVEVEVTSTGGKVDASDLIEYCKWFKEKDDKEASSPDQQKEAHGGHSTDLPDEQSPYLSEGEMFDEMSAEDEGPVEGDYVLSSTGPLGAMVSVGQVDGDFLGEFKDEDDAMSAIREHMEESNFFPSVWRESDHGNIHLISSIITADAKATWSALPDATKMQYLEDLGVKNLDVAKTPWEKLPEITRTKLQDKLKTAPTETTSGQAIWDALPEADRKEQLKEVGVLKTDVAKKEWLELPPITRTKLEEKFKTKPQKLEVGKRYEIKRPDGMKEFNLTDIQGNLATLMDDAEKKFTVPVATLESGLSKGQVKEALFDGRTKEFCPNCQFPLENLNKDSAIQLKDCPRCSCSISASVENSHKIESKWNISLPLNFLGDLHQQEDDISDDQAISAAQQVAKVLEEWKGKILKEFPEVHKKDIDSFIMEFESVEDVDSFDDTFNNLCEYADQFGILLNQAPSSLKESSTRLALSYEEKKNIMSEIETLIYERAVDGVINHNEYLDILNHVSRMAEITEDQAQTLGWRVVKKYKIHVKDASKKVALELWKHPKDYAGETYEEYYVGPVQSRDSDILEQANFISALEMLGGESEPDVIVARAGHWAVGWVETILVHKDSDKVAKLEEIEESLADYPVLDEELFSEMEYKGYQEDYDSWAKSDTIKELELEEQEDGSFIDLDGRIISEENLYNIVMELLSEGYSTSDTRQLTEKFNEVAEPIEQKQKRELEEGGQQKLPLEGKKQADISDQSIQFLIGEAVHYLNQYTPEISDFTDEDITYYVSQQLEEKIGKPLSTDEYNHVEQMVKSATIKEGCYMKEAANTHMRYCTTCGKKAGVMSDKAWKDKMQMCLGCNKDYEKNEKPKKTPETSKEIIHTEDKEEVKASKKEAKSSVDEGSAHELYLYITNDGDLARQMTDPIRKMLLKKMKKGIFDYDRSIKAWMNLADHAAHRYISEFGSPGDNIQNTFNKATRWETAKKLAEDFKAEADLGNFDYLLPKGPNPNNLEPKKFLDAAIADNPNFFKDPEVAKAHEDIDLCAVENEDLTVEGLIEKMYQWDESEHGVDEYIYDETKKDLEAQGAKMPDDIRRIEGKKTAGTCFCGKPPAPGMESEEHPVCEEHLQDVEKAKDDLLKDWPKGASNKTADTESFSTYYGTVNMSSDEHGVTLSAGDDFDTDELAKDLEEKGEIALTYDFFEDLVSNSGWNHVSPEDIGALTEAPILGDDVNYDDHGNLEGTGNIYWYPNYQIRSYFEDLIEEGETFFERAADESPSYNEEMDKESSKKTAEEPEDDLSNLSDKELHEKVKRDLGESEDVDEKVQALAEFLGVEPSDIYQDSQGYAIEGDSEGAEYTVLTDEEADHTVLSRVRQDLEDDPGMFNQDWIQRFVTISETDKRMIAQEEADSRLEDMMDDDIVA